MWSSNGTLPWQRTSRVAWWRGTFVAFINWAPRASLPKGIALWFWFSAQIPLAQAGRTSALRRWTTCSEALGFGFADFWKGNVVGIVGVVQPMLFAVWLPIHCLSAATARAQSCVRSVRIQRALDRHWTSLRMPSSSHTTWVGRQLSRINRSGISLIRQRVHNDRIGNNPKRVNLSH